MAYIDQAAVDAAFADLDDLLDDRTPETRSCPGCGCTVFDRCSNPGTGIQYYECCRDCGAVQTRSFGVVQTTLARRCPSSNYKRIHHFHERISQLLMCESRIPDDQFLQIAERLCDGSHAVINKDVIRGVLRSLNMQLYIEKWLQIIQRITLIEPPHPGGRLLTTLDDMFQELQTPFKNVKSTRRKNFLNYNYVLCRLFQKLGCPQFCMFFPLIKSRQKLKVLDEMWTEMATLLRWEVTPLQLVPPFAVKLEAPDQQLQRIRLQVASGALAETRTMPARTEFRKSDLRLLHELDRQTALVRRRSTPPEPVPQRPGSSTRRSPYASVGSLQPLRRSRLLRRPV